MRPMKKLQYRLTLPSRENNIEDRYNDGVEGHPASRILSVIPDENFTVTFVSFENTKI